MENNNKNQKLKKRAREKNKERKIVCTKG